MGSAEARHELVRLILGIGTPAVLVWFVSLWWMMRPFSRYQRAQGAGAVSPRAIK